MADKRKNKKVLVKVSNLNEEALDKALDNALDALFGPDEEENTQEKPAGKSTLSEKTQPAKPRRKK